MTDYVLGFYFTPKHVLLILKDKPEWQKGLYNGLGGKIEPGETQYEAMVREFKEESGLDVCDWQSVLIMKNDTIGFSVEIFAAHGDELKPTGSAEEPVRYFDCNKLPSNIIPNLKWLVPICYEKLFGQMNYEVHST